jgi:Holliday junction DNA helicase RuvA
MIGKLRGTFAGETDDGCLYIDVGGVGYLIHPSPMARERARESGEAELYIHMAVREDAIDLYGFASRDELSFFKMLTGVSGIGPKTALGILAIADLNSLRRAIAAGDATLLTKVYGVGKKSAERIVVELRDKLAHEEKARGSLGGAPAIAIDAEVLEALQALGYSAAESRHALQSVSAGATDVRERLAAALKNLGTPA